MFKRARPIEIDCDAPSYSIVKACHLFGLKTPEDVRWCRLRNFVPSAHGRRPRLFDLQSWKALLGMSEPREAGCFCGGERPKVERYTFTYVTGRQAHYLIGQCQRCHTVFWEEA